MPYSLQAVAAYEEHLGLLSRPDEPSAGNSGKRGPGAGGVVNRAWRSRCTCSVAASVPVRSSYRHRGVREHDGDSVRTAAYSFFDIRALGTGVQLGELKFIA